MIFTVELNEQEVQTELEELLKKRASDMTRDAVGRWNTREMIDEKLKALLADRLDEIITDFLSKEDLEVYVKKSFDSIIKTQVKKAMKG